MTEQPLGVGNLPEVDQRTSDDNTAFVWSVSVLPGGGLALEVSERINATTSLGNYHDITADQLGCVDAS